MRMQYAKIVVALLVITLISGCSATIRSSENNLPAPTETAQLLPSSTNTPKPTLTSTPLPTATITPVPVIFRDDFTDSLQEGWKWVRESKDYWSLTKTQGWLHIDSQNGSIHEATIRNLLMYPAPAGNFAIETKIRFKPTSNFQNAGIFIYHDNASFVHFNRAFCDQAQCVNDGLYFDSGENNKWSSKNFATSIPATDVVYLRIKKDESTYSAYYSLDGQEWTLVGIQINNLAPTFVGIEAGQAKETISAEFDYFEITELQ